MARKDPLAGLDAIPWRRLRTASPGHRATGLPAVLRELASIRDPERWLESFTALPAQAYLSHCHGPYVSEAAARAVPFVVALLPLAPNGDCLGCLLMELRALCVGVVTTREEILATPPPFGSRDESSLPTDEEIRRQRMFLERARSAVRSALPQIVLHLDHPLSLVRTEIYAMAQALPEERALFEPLLLKKLGQEHAPGARAALLRALGGEGVPREESLTPHPHEESPEPRLGIFWIIDGTVEAFSQPWSEVSAVAGFRDTDMGHVEVWPRVVASHPELRGLGYEQVPRGRVLLAEESGEFRLFTPSHEAKNRSLVEQVIAAFELPTERVRLCHDRHDEPPGRDLFREPTRRRKRQVP